MDIKFLVRKAKKGDKNALVKLIMAQKNDYYRLAFTYMKNKQDSMDALEDMIVTLYEKIHLLKKEDTFYSWSKVILVNKCKGILRKNKRVVPIDAVEEQVSEDQIKHKDDQILLEKQLKKLTPKHQEVIKLRYFLDYEYETIAKLLKIPVGTVKSRLSIGIRKLKESLGGEML